MNRIRVWLAITGLAAGMLLTPGYAQQTSGTITGIVTDTSGAAIPNATVTVTDISTKQAHTVTTNTQGEYTVPSLPESTYTVDVKAPNFRESVSNNVILHTSSTTTSNAQLQLGNVTESVTVNATAIQVQTDSAALGEVVDGQQVKQLPLNGRSFVELTQLQPGVSAANNFDTKNKGLQGGVDMSVNGNPTTNNLFLLDGVNNNDVGSNRTILIYPSNEAIAEFKMLTNSYGAQYGQASGAIISIVTRSGSNQFHGSAFYDGRNDALDAYNYFSARNAGKGLPLDGKDKLRRNDWGYSIGGPIKKDKLFFFFSEEWNHEIRGRTVGACVPTAAEEAGDFSQDFKASSTGSPTDQCGEQQPSIPTADQAAGNAYKFNAIDPSGATIMKLFPLPNLSALNGSGQNWSVSLPTGLYWREENARADYNLNAANAFMFRYTQDTWSNPAYNAGYWGDDPFPALNSSWAQPSKSLVGRWTATVGSSFVNDAAFSYSNNRIIITPGGTDPGLLAQVTAAVPTLYPESLKLSKQGVPQVNLGAYGSNNSTSLIAPWQNQENLYGYQDDASKVMGRHTIKFGALINFDGKDEDTGPATSERPNFSTGTSAGNLGTGGVQTNNNLANLLLPNNVFQISENSTNVRAQLRWRNYEFYAADTFKLTPRVTLDYGVRYSIMTPTFQPNNQLTSFQPQLYDPSKPASDACNGLWVAPGQDPCGDSNKKFGTAFSSGTPGPNKYLVHVNHHMFAPRVGIAWDVFGDGKTAVRAGGGQFYQRERVSRYTLVSNAPFSLNQSSYSRTIGGATPATLAGGTASPTGGYDPSDLLPNSWQWNATVEQSLSNNSILEISYVGNRGIHLTSSYDINTVPQANWLNASFVGGNAINAYRPFSNYSTLTYFAHGGNSNYNGLQVMLQSRVKQMQFQAAYTWSHSIADIVLDDSGGGLGAQSRTYYPNPRLDRGNGDTNRANNFVANATYYLPKLQGHNYIEQGALGGWELTGITSAANGNSFTVYQGGVGENTAALTPGVQGGGNLSALFQTGFTTPQRPLVNGNISCNAGHKGDQIVNPNAFTLVGYVIGTIPGNVEPRGYCQGPNFVNTDFSVDKNWTVKQRLTIQFRIDAFDVFNHANFNSSSGTFTPYENVNCGPLGARGYQACSPTNNVISAQTQTPGFGTSNATIGNAARQLQYTLHFNF